MTEKWYTIDLADGWHLTMNYPLTLHELVQQSPAVYQVTLPTGFSVQFRIDDETIEVLGIKDMTDVASLQIRLDKVIQINLT